MPRRTIVVARALVIAAWGTAISAWILLLSLVIGGLIGLPGWSPFCCDPGARHHRLCRSTDDRLAGDDRLLCRSRTRLLAPLGWAVAMVAASQVLAVLGWGAWFPSAVPAILAGAGGVAVEPVGPGGIALLVLAAAVDILATVAWWERADQTG